MAVLDYHCYFGTVSRTMLSSQLCLSRQSLRILIGSFVSHGRKYMHLHALR